MSDTPQGPDWWQASDDKWYPPPQPVMPTEATTAYPTSPPTAPVTSGPGAPYQQYQPPGAAPSPYGGTPTAPPGQGGPDRTALFITLGVLVAVLGVVLIVALSAGGDDDDGPQAAASTTEDTASVTTREVEPSEDPAETTVPEEPVVSSEVSALEVVEEGFSTYTDPLGDSQTGSFGFLIENTGDGTVVGAELSVTVLDEAGGIVTTESFTVGLIRPGETLGYGAELIQDPTNGIGDIEVQVGEPLGSYEAPAEGTFTVSNVNTTSDEYSTTTTFSVSSTYAQQVDFAEPHAIYRDSSGSIIGGGNGYMDFIPAGGQQTGEINIFTAIPNIAETEVYVDPGPFF